MVGRWLAPQPEPVSMTDDLFPLYRDGVPQEDKIKAALAAATVALVRLKGSQQAAMVFQSMAAEIRKGELGGPVKPRSVQARQVGEA